MNEKFCPFISTNGKKRACQKNECILFNTDESTCNINKQNKKEITITEGCNIAIGFTIWSIIIGIIILLLLWFFEAPTKDSKNFQTKEISFITKKSH